METKSRVSSILIVFAPWIIVGIISSLELYFFSIIEAEKICSYGEGVAGRKLLANSLLGFFAPTVLYFGVQKPKLFNKTTITGLVLTLIGILLTFEKFSCLF